MTDLSLRPMAVTMGEPAGIGTEVTLAAWQSRCAGDVPYFLIDDINAVETKRSELGINTPIKRIESPSDAIGLFDHALPVLHQPRDGDTRPGHPVVDTARAVIASIETAVRLTLSSEASAVITNPIQKSILYQAGFGFPGHTEFLGFLCGPKSHPVMMLASQALKVVPVSIHISLRHAIEVLTTELIVEQAQITWRGLRRNFAIHNPRLAIAGLNPHAGEDNSMGSEDDAIITPAINLLRDQGIAASGPYPPDTLFTERARPTYDVAICMYHDQALIPIKTLDFDGGVNVTLGLPIVRTSPDHGTALDIAGQGIASSASLLSAIRMAGLMAGNRARAAA